MKIRIFIFVALIGLALNGVVFSEIKIPAQVGAQPVLTSAYTQSYVYPVVKQGDYFCAEMEPRREIASVEGNEYYACLIRDWHSIKPQCRGAGDIIFKDDKMIEGKYLAFEVSGDKPRVVDRIFLSDSEFSQRGWSKENEITGKVKIILTCVDINSQLRK